MRCLYMVKENVLTFFCLELLRHLAPIVAASLLPMSISHDTVDITGSGQWHSHVLQYLYFGTWSWCRFLYFSRAFFGFLLVQGSWFVGIGFKPGLGLFITEFVPSCDADMLFLFLLNLSLYESLWDIYIYTHPNVRIPKHLSFFPVASPSPMAGWVKFR